MAHRPWASYSRTFVCSFYSASQVSVYRNVKCEMCGLKLKNPASVMRLRGLMFGPYVDERSQAREKRLLAASCRIMLRAHALTGHVSSPAAIWQRDHENFGGGGSLADSPGMRLC